ncbi:TIGR01244 family phosphatase [Halieaceae bacterium IMCC8485]|uniref:TIGR01244 family phosphatase n=1 Tax=Candidatus Seongchinamella marina TaxID=2518990 RepID=A0ABT3SZU4_9GAMM|nr:bifunctional protein tyrosine phosphatase family protein/NAD(P)/FAD-dependent oxidoreductase [Candidatus Seongchinamella marina]MCX2975523.1 TIGR01244 family phosphatase [Candidatus Seongchinamella marina]
MHIKTLDNQVSISDQISVDDLTEIAKQGVEILICNRPDGESDHQETFASLEEAAKSLSIEMLHIPFRNGELNDTHRSQFIASLKSGKKVHAYCRTGNRSTMLWASCLQQLGTADTELLEAAQSAGFEVSDVLGIATEPNKEQTDPLGRDYHEVVIVGAGSGGIAVASSLLKRKPDLRIAIVDASQEHFYQPGWTMVGGGVFRAEDTRRSTQKLMPRQVTWIQKPAAVFHPQEQKLELEDGSCIHYGQLIVSPGLKLDWTAIEGLSESLGSNGVTSNYRYDLAPYTWQLVQALKRGKAVFTQPPMPIKCAGAPQKALYLSADHWFRQGSLKDISIDFFNAGGALFGVETYVPALMSYIEKYNAQLRFNHTLTKVDGEKQRAWFKTKNEAGEEQSVETDFDMLHVCPPQIAPDFIRSSPLADDSGWLDVDQHTLQHKKYPNVWGLGDVINTPNAKTMAAARKQAPVVAENVCNVIDGQAPTTGYDGYGSCPLTVERGKIVLAEFGYGGKLLPSFPSWVNNGTTATKRAWFLKATLLPSIYWHGMLKGREWMVAPEKLSRLD